MEEGEQLGTNQPAAVAAASIDCSSKPSLASVLASDAASGKMALDSTQQASVPLETSSVAGPAWEGVEEGVGQHPCMEVRHTPQQNMFGKNWTHQEEVAAIANTNSDFQVLEAAAVVQQPSCLPEDNNRRNFHTNPSVAWNRGEKVHPCNYYNYLAFGLQSSDNLSTVNLSHPNSSAVD